MIDLIIDLHISMFFLTLGTSPCLNQRCFQLAFVTGACALHTNQIKQMKPLTHSRHTHTDSQDDTNKFSDQRSKARQLVTVMSREEHYGPGVVPVGWRCGRNKHAVVF